MTASSDAVLVVHYSFLCNATKNGKMQSVRQLQGHNTLNLHKHNIAALVTRDL